MIQAPGRGTWTGRFLSLQWHLNSHGLNGCFSRLATRVSITASHLRCCLAANQCKSVAYQLHQCSFDAAFGPICKDKWFGPHLQSDSPQLSYVKNYKIAHAELRCLSLIDIDWSTYSTLQASRRTHLSYRSISRSEVAAKTFDPTSPTTYRYGHCTLMCLSSIVWGS